MMERSNSATHSTVHRALDQVVSRLGAQGVVMGGTSEGQRGFFLCPLLLFSTASTKSHCGLMLTYSIAFH